MATRVRDHIATDVKANIGQLYGCSWLSGKGQDDLCARKWLRAFRQVRTGRNLLGRTLHQLLL